MIARASNPWGARAGDVGYDQLHHFVAAGAWDSVPLEAALLKEADRLVGGRAAFLVIDDTIPSRERSETVCAIAKDSHGSNAA